MFHLQNIWKRSRIAESDSSDIFPVDRDVVVRGCVSDDFGECTHFTNSRRNFKIRLKILNQMIGDVGNEGTRMLETKEEFSYLWQSRKRNETNNIIMAAIGYKYVKGEINANEDSNC